MEPLGIAAMGYDAMTIIVALVEAEHHAIERGDHRKRGAVHLLRSLRFQNSVPAIGAVLKMSNHETRHIRAGRSKSTRGRGSDQFIGLFRLGCESVALRHIRL